MSWRKGFALPLVLLLGAGLWAEDLEKLRGKLARENDPSKRAKISVKIGRELLKESQRLYRAETYDLGHEKLQEYLAVVSTAFEDLQSSGRQARRKPRGFKDLEIHLRKSRRTLEDVARSLPFDVREPVQKTVQKMKDMRAELLDAIMNVNTAKRTKREGGG